MKQNGPKYIGIYERIKDDLRQGIYPPGSFLPTEPELMKKYSASKTTVRHAVSLLREEGIIAVRQGSGMRVNESFSLQESGRNAFQQISGISVEFLGVSNPSLSCSNPIIDLVPAELRVASALHLSQSEEVYRMQRLLFVNEQAYSYVVNYFPKSLVPDLDAHAHEINSLYAFLKEEYNLVCTDARESIIAINAGFQESRFLAVNTGTPLLLILRTSTCEQGLLEYSETTLHPGLAALTTQVIPRY